MNTFELNDRVTLIAIQTEGFIDGIMHEAKGTSYRVVYWDNCERYSEWCYSHEIEKKVGEE